MSTKTEERLVRIESKLTRLMLSLGMDAEGNPARGLLILDHALTDRVLDALELLMDTLDARDGVTFADRPEYAIAEALYNQLVGIREARWPNS